MRRNGWVVALIVVLCCWSWGSNSNCRCCLTVLSDSIAAEGGGGGEDGGGVDEIVCSVSSHSTLCLNPHGGVTESQDRVEGGVGGADEEKIEENEVEKNKDSKSTLSSMEALREGVARWLRQEEGEDALDRVLEVVVSKHNSTALNAEIQKRNPITELRLRRYTIVKAKKEEESNFKKTCFDYVTDSNGNVRKAIVECPKEKRILEYVMEARGVKESTEKSAQYADWFWTKISLPTIRLADRAGDVFKLIQYPQRVNRIPFATEINRKDSLAINLSSFAKKFPDENFKFHPETFELPRDEALVIEAMKEDSNLHWIAKPTFGGQGMGIHLSSNATDLIIKSRNASMGQYILQKYIRNPLLLNGFKFTMRLYLAISSIDPLRVWLYRDGIVKFTTMPYSNATEFFNDDNMLMHITNQALNKGQQTFAYSTDPSVDNIGSRWSIQAMRKFIREQGKDDQLLWDRIKDALVKTIATISQKMLDGSEELYDKNACFQLFGVDVDVDSDLNPWLIEANVNPTLGGSKAAFDNAQKEFLLNDFFDLVGLVPYNRTQLLKQISTRIQQKLPSFIELSEQEKGALSSFVLEILYPGGFDLIFPFPTTQSQYEKFFPKTHLNTLASELLKTVAS